MKEIKKVSCAWKEGIGMGREEGEGVRKGREWEHKIT